jgi:hypothetical protein
MTFTGSTALGKMRDAHPLDLFTLRRAFVRFTQATNIDGFLYLFVMALWTEAVENRQFSVPIRTLILETLLLFFYVQYSLVSTKSIYPMIFQKSWKLNNGVAFATNGKIAKDHLHFVSSIVWASA